MIARYKDPATQTPESINDIRTLPQRFKKKLKEEPGKVLLYGAGAGLLMFGLGKAFNLDGQYGNGASIGFAIVGITFGLLIVGLSTNDRSATQTAQNNAAEESK